MEYETTEQDSTRLPQPLTRRNGDGAIYQRLPAVDRQIQEALRLDHEELRGHLEVCDEASPVYLKVEVAGISDPALPQSRKPRVRQRSGKVPAETLCDLD